MTMAAAEEVDLFAFLSADPPPQSKTASARRTLMAGFCLLALILAAAIAIPAVLVADKRATLESELDQRLRILAESRAQLLGAWLEANSRVAARISESELFRLFATEAAMTGGDLSAGIPEAQDPFGSSQRSGEVNPLVLQLPYMTQMLTDFARESDFLSAYLVVGPRACLKLAWKRRKNFSGRTPCRSGRCGLPRPASWPTWLFRCCRFKVILGQGARRRCCC
jgi:hypothetical protein